MDLQEFCLPKSYSRSGGPAMGCVFFAWLGKLQRNPPCFIRRMRNSESGNAAPNSPC
jgi:hypothetical protein